MIDLSSRWPIEYNSWQAVHCLGFWYVQGADGASVRKRHRVNKRPSTPPHHPPSLCVLTTKPSFIHSKFYVAFLNFATSVNGTKKTREGTESKSTFCVRRRDPARSIKKNLSPLYYNIIKVPFSLLYKILIHTHSWGSESRNLRWMLIARSEHCTKLNDFVISYVVSMHTYISRKMFDFLVMY